VEGIDEGSEDGWLEGLDEGSEDCSTDGFEDGVSLRVKDGSDEASEDGCEDGCIDITRMLEDGWVEGVALSLGWALQDGAVEVVVLGEEVVDGLADLADLELFILRRFELFPPSSHSSSDEEPDEESVGWSLRRRDLDKRRKH
jgi:hypothetical protein